MSNKLKLLGAVAAVALMTGAMAGKADAALISGEIGFGGAANINLATNFVDIIGNSANVNFALGDLAAVVAPVTYNDFFYDGTSLPVLPLWSDVESGFVFNLTSISSFTEGANSVESFGSGTLMRPGYDPTPFLFSFSADKTGSVFSFSATNAPVPMPEPASLAVFGAALAGLGLARRRAKKAA